MVVKIDEAISFIPRAVPSDFKVEIVSSTGGTTDVSDNVLWGECSLINTVAIGEFTIRLDNDDGSYNSLWTGGEIVNCYVDSDTDNLTLIFKGTIESITKTYQDGDDYRIELKGGHISKGLLNGKSVTESYTNIEISVILKALIAKYTTGYTVVNVATTTTTVSISWEDTSLWQCIIDLCNKALFDCYVDNTYDLHFFDRDSITNYDEAIVEDDTLLSEENLTGTVYDIKNRILVYGKDDGVRKIIHMAEDTTNQALPGIGVREKVIKDDSILTIAQAIDRANYELIIGTANIVTGKAKCYGMPKVNPGELIYVEISSMDLLALYTISTIVHRFGHDVDHIIETSVMLDNQPKSFQHMYSEQIKKLNETQSKTNPNHMMYSHILEFNSSTDAESLSGVTIEDGKLKLTTTTGTFISTQHTAHKTIEHIEVRMLATDDIVIGTTATINVSCNGGVSYKLITDVGINGNIPAIIDIPEAFQGEEIVVKIKLTATATYVNPEIESFVVLYS